jgi:hypothetical protein
MSEFGAEQPERPQDLSAVNPAAYRQHALDEIQELDPELLTNPQTRQLVEMSVDSGIEITETYGTPEHPKLVSGNYETDIVTPYHSGGEDGHTSFGPLGSGVPRNVLKLSNAINEAAGEEIVEPVDRATGLYAGSKHDSILLHGRALMPEGQGHDRGDERLSAERARDDLLQEGSDPEIATTAHDQVLATAYDPETHAQNVQYGPLIEDPANSRLIKNVLGQEIITGADLLNPTSRRAALGSIEHTVESMCLSREDKVLNQRLEQLGIDIASLGSIEDILTIIGDDEVLRQKFIEQCSGEASFFRDHIKYSDTVIRQVTGGKGIDDLSPGREDNATIMDRFVEELHQGRHPVHIWKEARRIAGYEDPER